MKKQFNNEKLYLRFSKAIPIFLTLATFLFAFSQRTLYGQTGTIQIGSGNDATINSSNYYIPVSSAPYTYSQQIITVAEYKNGGGDAGNITKIRYKFTYLGDRSKYENWVMYIGHTSKAEFSSVDDFEPISSLQQVFSGVLPVLVADEWFEIEFTTPFLYNGIDNIVVAVNEITPSTWGGHPTVLSYETTLNRGLAYYNNDNAIDVNNPTTEAEHQKKMVKNVPQLQFEGTLATCIPPVNASFTQTSLTSVDLHWNNHSGSTSPATYDIEWGKAGFTVGSGTAVNGITTTTTPIETVLDVDYEYYIQRNCGSDGNSVVLGHYPFKTKYCDDLHLGCNISYGSKITNVKITDAIVPLSNETSLICGEYGYSNFKNLYVSASANQTPSFEVSINSTGYVKIWIDWNKNGIFGDSPGELVDASNSLITESSPFIGTIIIPSLTLVGDYRMRIRLVDNNKNYDGCSKENGGETQDYTFRLVTSPTCYPPLNLSFTHNSLTNATLHWTAHPNSPNPQSYELEWGEAGFTLGSGSLHTLSDPNFTVTTIEDVNYEFYVRQNCGAGGWSDWTGPFSFATAYCTPIHTSFMGNVIDQFKSLNASVNIDYQRDYSDYETTYYNLYNSEDHIIEQIAGTNTNFELAYWGGSDYLITIWVDWNHDGIFNNEDELIHNKAHSYYSNPTKTLELIGSQPGTYRMRVRVFENPTNYSDACIFSESGSSLDCKLVLTEPASCAGSPSTGMIEFDPPFAAPESPVTIKAEGYTIATNMQYQWSYSTDGGNTWIIEPSSSTYQHLSGQTMPSFGNSVTYKFEVTCTTDGSYAQAIETITSDYCKPIYDHDGDYISEFQTIDADNNTEDIFSAYPTNGYIDLSSNPSIKQVAGKNINFTHNYTTYSRYLKIWIDKNANGIFENTELVHAKQYEGTYLGTMNIIGIQPGTYRMRVRSYASYEGIPVHNSCEEFLNGSTIDYTIEITAPLGCTTTPTIGTISFEPNSISPSDVYSVKISDYAVENGLTYTWEKSLDNGTTWEAPALYTGNSYEDITGQIAPALGESITYKLTVSCQNGGTPAEATAIIASNYCKPKYQTTGIYGYINKFETTNLGINNISDEFTSVPTDRYADLTGNPSIKQVAGANIDIQYSSSHGGNYYMNIWVDWNLDGVFQASEIVHNGNFAYPLKAGVMDLEGSVQGIYRMRVRAVENKNEFNACETLYYGSAIDYTLELTAPPACAGTPSTGTISFEPENVAPNDIYSVKASGYTVEDGLTFTWEKSLDNGATWETPALYTGNIYQNVANQVAPSIGEAVTYKLTVTCSNGGGFAENTETIISDYCKPLYAYSANNYAYIEKFKTINATEENVETNKSSRPTDGYLNLYDDANGIIKHKIGENINFEYRHQTTSHLRIWIDLNHDGIFGTDEEAFADWSNINSNSGIINLSGINAVAGIYRMRVRSLEEYTNGMVSFNACEILPHGSTTDYKLELITASCLPATNPSFNEISSTEIQLQWTANGSNVESYNVEWGINPITKGMGTIIPSITTTSTNISPVVAGANYQFYVQQNCGTGGNSIWTGPFTFSTTPPCDPVTAIVTSNVTATTVDVAWTNGGTETNWIIEYGATGFAHGSGVTVNATTNPQEITGLTAETDYDIYVKADCGSGNESSWTGPVNITTIATAPPPPPCDPVTAIVTSNVTATTVDVAWTNGGTETNWIIEYGATGFAHGSGVTINPATNPQQITGLTAETDYDIYVRADCGSGNVSDWTGPKAVTTTATTPPPPTCDPVTAIVTSNVTATTVDVAWTNGGTETAWSITYVPTGGTPGDGPIISATNPYRITGLAPGTSYDIYVQANCGSGSLSSWTGPETVKTAELSSGLNDLEFISNVSLFPNPATNEVSLQFTLSEISDITIKVIDLNGKVMETQNINNAISGSNTTTLNVSNYANGIYSVVLQSNDTLTTKKLVINK